MKPALSFCLIAFSFFLVLDPVLAADTTAPQTQGTMDPDTPDGSNGWYKSPVTVTLSATDLDSGVKSINFRLDSGNWNSVGFSSTLNLVQNSSFEMADSGQVANWSFSGMPSSTGVSDSTIHQFGSRSIKVSSYENGWSGFNNQASYIPAAPFANMTASVWVKTQSISGSGVLFKIFALTPSGPLHLADSPAITGTSGFTRISRSFSVSSDTAYGIYLDLGVMGAGTAWFDAVGVTVAPTDTQVVNTYSSPGSHTLDYYSVDYSDNTESPYKTLNFNVDSTAPTNWRDFGATETGNSHTLTSQINVTDSASGLSVTDDMFQYSTDGGLTWGYNTDLLSCGSSWVSNGWSPIISSVPPVSGVNTATLFTPPIDYCNSDWKVCKIIRFKEKDIAGNESTKDICINGAWIRVSGDVGSNYNINFQASASGENSDGLVSAHGSVSNFSTETGWIISDYNVVDVPSYAELLSQFPTSTALPSGKLPTTSGRYLVNSSFTVSSSTIPSNYGNYNFSAVIFVNGNLTVNADLNTSNLTSMLFIISGDVLVDKDVQNIRGNFVTDGEFDTSYNGNKGRQLNIYGSIEANVVSFNRSLGNDADTTPSEQVIFQPVGLLGLTSVMGNTSIGWKEVLP